MMINPTVAVIVETAVQQLSPSAPTMALGASACRVSRAMLRVVLRNQRETCRRLDTRLARAVGDTKCVSDGERQCPSAMPDGCSPRCAHMPPNIALEMAYAMELHRAALFASGLILMAMELVLLALVDRLEGRAGHA